MSFHIKKLEFYLVFTIRKTPKRMFVDAAHITSVLASPFDDLDATSLAVHTIAICSHMFPSHNHTQSLQHCRGWLDALLFLWASPSPIAASDPRRDVVWLELQLVAIKAIEVVLCHPLSPSPGMTNEVTPSSVYSYWSRSEQVGWEGAASASPQPAFEHWVIAFVSMLEKELHVVAAELQRHNVRPRRDFALRRLEAISESLIRVVGLAETEGGLLLPLRLIQSPLVWQNVFRVVTNCEPALLEQAANATATGIVREVVALLLHWWCRAASICVDLAPAQQVMVDIVKGGAVMRELTRLMCLNQSKDAIVSAVPLQAAYLCALMSSLWWRDVANVRADMQGTSRMASLLRLIGGCAASEHRSSSHREVGDWMHMLQHEWAQLTMIAACSVQSRHSELNATSCALCGAECQNGGGKGSPSSVCGDVISNFRLLIFVVQQQCDAVNLVLGGTRTTGVATMRVDDLQHEMYESIALLRKRLANPALQRIALSSAPEATQNKTLVDELARSLQLLKVVIVAESAMPPCTGGQPFWAAAISALLCRFENLLMLPKYIEVVTDDSERTASCCLIIRRLSRLNVMERNANANVYSTWIDHVASATVSANMSRDQIVRTLALCSALLP
jgi:hypothetical protein